MFSQIYIWCTFPSLLPEGSGTVRPSWNLGFSVFSHIFWIWLKIRLAPVCRRPTLSRIQGRIRRSPIHSGYAQGNHTRIRSCRNHFFQAQQAFNVCWSLLLIIVGVVVIPVVVVVVVVLMMMRVIVVAVVSVAVPSVSLVPEVKVKLKTKNQWFGGLDITLIWNYYLW